MDLLAFWESIRAVSDTGDDRTAFIYTVVRTAKLNGVILEAVYRKDTLAKVAEGHSVGRIDELIL